MALFEMLQKNRSPILAIATKHGAFNVRVFGSVVRGEETPESDIDFLVDYDAEKTTPWFPGGLLMDLQDLLERKVDILTERGIILVHDYLGGIDFEQVWGAIEQYLPGAMCK